MSTDPGQLRDEIALRAASLADARREHELGDLSDGQFATIERRDTLALETARRDLALLATAPFLPATRAPRVRRVRWLVVAAASFAVALGLVLYAALAPRQAGSSATGSLSLGRGQHISQLLTGAEADVANANLVAALVAYQEVLVLDPHNVQALTQSGWLDFSAGSAAHRPQVVELGIRNLEQAIAIAPRAAAPRLYFAIVADSTPGNQAVARRQFELFLKLGPSNGQMAIARPFLAKLGLR